jgi:serine/threonine-protein kinase
MYASGFLVYGAAGALRAVRFDPDRLTILGDPVPVVEQVLISPIGGANAALSRDGSLVFVPMGAGAPQSAERSLVWVGRDGREEPLKLPTRPYEGPRLSPPGTRIAVAVLDAQYDIWIGDAGRETLTRLTFDPATDQTPIWTPDGTSIIWSSQRNGMPNLYLQTADGAGAVRQISSNPYPTFVTSITPDGTRVVGWENRPGTRQDIFALDVAPPGSQQAPSSQLLVHSQAVELDPEISPDGRWLAYESDESGRPEIYVRPFPNVDVGRWEISTTGGTRPAWARSGRELFYLDAAGFLTSVQMHAGESTIEAGNPVRLFTTKYYPGFTGLGLDLRGYDVSPDGRRFLMLKNVQSDRDAASPTPGMVVVLNWTEELKARIPGK